jgi:hypothetical protein
MSEYSVDAVMQGLKEALQRNAAKQEPVPVEQDDEGDDASVYTGTNTDTGSRYNDEGEDNAYEEDEDMHDDVGESVDLNAFIRIAETYLDKDA